MISDHSAIYNGTENKQHRTSIIPVVMCTTDVFVVVVDVSQCLLL